MACTAPSTPFGRTVNILVSRDLKGQQAAIANRLAAMYRALKLEN